MVTDKKITDLAALTGASIAAGDLFELDDVSDTSMSATGTNKKVRADDVGLGLPGVPSGELVGTTLQAQLYELDTRLGKLARLSQLDTAVELWDYFMGFAVEDGEIGELGWSLSLTGTSTISTIVSSETTSTGRIGLNVVTSTTSDQAALYLMPFVMNGAPVFTLAWRAKLSATNDGTNNMSIYIGGGKTIGSAAEPTDGFYFALTSADSSWHFKTAKASTRSDTDTNVASDANYHWFIITSDGAGTIKAWIKDSIVDWLAALASPDVTVTDTTKFPGTATPDTWGPFAQAIKTLGTTLRGIRLSKFYIRYEHV